MQIPFYKNTLTGSVCLFLSTDFQNYLRTQAGNTTVVNIIICTVDYLLRLQVTDVIQTWYLSFFLRCRLLLAHSAYPGVKYSGQHMLCWVFLMLFNFLRWLMWTILQFFLLYLLFIWDLVFDLKMSFFKFKTIFENKKYCVLDTLFYFLKWHVSLCQILSFKMFIKPWSSVTLDSWRSPLYYWRLHKQMQEFI